MKNTYNILLACHKTSLKHKLLFMKNKVWLLRVFIDGVHTLCDTKASTFNDNSASTFNEYMVNETLGLVHSLTTGPVHSTSTWSMKH